MAATALATRWKRRLLILVVGLAALGVGLVALDGYVVHVAYEVDRIAYGWYEWYRGTDPCIAGEFTSDKGPVVGLAFLPVGTQIVLGTRAHGLELWDAEKGELLACGSAEPEFVGGIAFSSDGTRIVSVHGLREKTCVVWDVSQGTSRRFRLNEARAGDCVALSPDGRTMAVATWKAIDVYDISRALKVSAIIGPSGYRPDGCPVFSADGKRLLFAEGSGFFVKELGNGGKLERIGKEDRPVSQIALSPDGNRVALAGEGFVAIWELDKKQRLYRTELRPADISLPHVYVSDVAFSPDGRMLAVSVSYFVMNCLRFHANRASVLLLDADSGKQLGEWRAGPQTFFGEIAFSPNGRLLAVALAGKVRLLDVSALLQRPEVKPVCKEETTEQ